MDATRFDDLVKALGSGTTRRRVLGVLGGSVAAVLGSRPVARGQGNNACAAFCKEVFPSGPKRGECVSAAARGDEGNLCAACEADPANVCLDADGAPTCTCDTCTDDWVCCDEQCAGCALCVDKVDGSRVCAADIDATTCEQPCSADADCAGTDTPDCVVRFILVGDHVASVPCPFIFSDPACVALTPCGGA